jgi:amino acid adenylation domain-containing protein
MLALAALYWLWPNDLVPDWRPLGRADDIAVAFFSSFVAIRLACERIPTRVTHLGAIATRFVDWSRRTPTRPALIYEGDVETYAELEANSRSLAARLFQTGVRAGDVVAILAERGPTLVRAVLAISRLGGVFVVLDASYPDQRLRTLIAICRPKLIVCAGGEPLARRSQGLAASEGLAVFDASAPGPFSEAPTLELDVASAERPAYFLFTSGSTGRPKCVACSHRPLSHFVTWQADVFALTANDRFTQLSGISHDPFLRDVFTPLSIGAALHIPTQATLTSPASLALWVKSVRATVAHLTPALGEVLAAGRSRAGELADLRLVFWGGDQLRRSLTRDLAALAPRAEQVNFYGCTETPQAACYHRIDPGEDRGDVVPIGRGADGFEVTLVDEQKRRLEDGVGEIAVRSDFLSLGYVEAGVVQPPTDRGVYYTGDRGFLDANGDLVWVGRRDDQVKVRGFRVDLSEITAALVSHPQAASAIALAVGEGESLQIVGFVAAGGAAALSSDDLQAHLSERLPPYMAPAQLLILPDLPLLPNGKVDRRSLVAAAQGGGANDGAATRPEDFTEAERTLVAAWRDLFPNKPVDGDTTFLSLGGDSLSYVEAYLAVEQAVGRAPDGWETQTIMQLAAARRPPSRGWRVIDTSMAVRALAIIGVVAGHLIPAFASTGATSALLLVSGFMFGNLQLRDASQRQSAAPLIGPVLRILPPTYLYIVYVFLEKTFRGHATTVQMFLLNNDAINYEALAFRYPYLEDFQYHLWYVDALIKIILLIYVLYSAMLAIFDGRVTAKTFTLGLFVVGVIIRFGAPIAADSVTFGQQLPALSLFQFFFVSHLSTFVLGTMCALWEGKRDKIILAGVGLLYAGATGVYYGPEHAAATVLAVGVLLGLRRIAVPRFASKLIFLVSGASLFIYLMQFTFASAVSHVFGDHHAVMQLLAAVVGGVVVWKAWTWATAAADARAFALWTASRPARPRTDSQV